MNSVEVFLKSPEGQEVLRELREKLTILANEISKVASGPLKILTDSFLDLIMETGEKFIKKGSKLGKNVVKIVPGVGDAFIIAENFIGDSNVTLILGDNIFYGDGLKDSLSKEFKDGASIACCKVNDPERYGVAKIKDNNVLEIIEKPSQYISDFAVTGIYVYDNSVIEKSKTLSPSPRGELEITDLNNLYIKDQELKASFLDSEMVWMDTGTFDSLYDAASLVKALQNRSGHLIGSPELTAYQNNWLQKHEIEKDLNFNNTYAESLLASLDNQTKE